MLRAFYWLLPHPFLTLLLAGIWTLLQNEVSAGMVVVGASLDAGAAPTSDLRSGDRVRQIFR